MANNDEILTIDDLASYIKISVNSLYKLVQAGGLPGMKIGRHWRFSRSAITEWIKKGSTPTDVKDKQQHPGTALKVASFFAGIGGFDLGLEKAGMQIIYQCEIDEFCQKVLKKHWPNIPLHGDILNLSVDDIPAADLWCGGFPCQDLSSANQGKRKGLEGGRSGLFYKYAELIGKRRPRWVITENVPGLLNSNDGEDFKIVIGKLEELGYCVSWRILDAKYFGTPQRRRRVYVVASYRNIGSARVLFEEGAVTKVPRAGLGQKDIIAPRLQKGIGDDPVYVIQHAAIGRKPEAGPQAKGFRNDGETYTLDSRGSADVVCATTASFGVRDIAGLSTQMDSNRYRAIGNAVAVPVIEWLGRRIMLEEQERYSLSTVRQESHISL